MTNRRTHQTPRTLHSGRHDAHALRTPRAADWGFSRHQRSMRRCRLVERPSPPPPRRRATPAQSLRESAAAQGVRASPWLHSPSCGSGSDTCGSAAEPRPQPWAGALGRLRGYVRWAFIFSANENSTDLQPSGAFNESFSTPCMPHLHCTEMCSRSYYIILPI